MKIYAVGFRKRPEAWPSEWDFRPLPRTHPPEGPIVVHLSALKRFIRFAQRMAASQASGRLPEAVLYVPKGKEPPPEAAVYFDAVVREGEEARLAELLSCPLRLSMDEWVEELPLEAVFTPEPWKYGRLPEAVRQHLGACKSCREAFREALEARRRFHRAFCPDAWVLAAYARGESSEEVKAWEPHLSRCPACRVEVRVLQRTEAPEPVWKRVWEKVAAYLGIPSSPLPIGIGLGDLAGAVLRSEPAWTMELLTAKEFGAPLFAFLQIPSIRDRWEGSEGEFHWTVRRSPVGEVWLTLEAEGEASRKVQVILADPAWLKPKIWTVKLKPVRPGRVGATLSLGRVSHLDLRADTTLFLRPEEADA